VSEAAASLIVMPVTGPAWHAPRPQPAATPRRS